jgi:hypothetical protein
MLGGRMPSRLRESISSRTLQQRQRYECTPIDPPTADATTTHITRFLNSDPVPAAHVTPSHASSHGSLPVAWSSQPVLPLVHESPFVAMYRSTSAVRCAATVANGGGHGSCWPDTSMSLGNIEHALSSHSLTSHRRGRNRTPLHATARHCTPLHCRPLQATPRHATQLCSNPTAFTSTPLALRPTPLHSLRCTANVTPLALSYPSGGGCARADSVAGLGGIRQLFSRCRTRRPGRDATDNGTSSLSRLRNSNSWLRKLHTKANRNAAVTTAPTRSRQANRHSAATHCPNLSFVKSPSVDGMLPDSWFLSSRKSLQSAPAP